MTAHSSPGGPIEGRVRLEPATHQERPQTEETSGGAGLRAELDQGVVGASSALVDHGTIREDAIEVLVVEVQRDARSKDGRSADRAGVSERHELMAVEEKSRTLEFVR